MDQPWIYIVLIGLVIIVYAFILPRKKPSPELQGSVLSEMESAMDHFAAELEEQNQALIRLFSDTKREFEQQHVRLESKIEALEKQVLAQQQELVKLGLVQEQWHASRMAPQAAAEPSAAYGQAAVSVQEEPETAAAPAALSNIRERYAELLTLYGEGKSVEFIARKLGMNKGEVALIVQLAKQEGRGDV